MAKVKHLAQGTPLPEWFLDDLQEFLSSYVSPNFQVTISAPAVLAVPAGTGTARVTIAVGDPGATIWGWRWITAQITAAAPGTLVVGDNDVYVTGSTNGPYTGTNPEVDNTTFAFGLMVLPPGTTPSGTGAQAYYRKVATAAWDGTKFTGVKTLVGLGQGSVAPTAAGTLLARPAPTGSNAATLYLATDVNGGTLYRSDGAAWTKAALGASETPSMTGIAAAILLSGLYASRPAAVAGNAGFYYYATDENGGTLYRSNGSSWNQVGLRAGQLHPAEVVGLMWSPGVLPGHAVSHLGFSAAADIQSDPNQALRVGAPSGWVLPVSTGYALIQGTDGTRQGAYLAPLTPAGSVTMTTHNPGAQPRIDAIVARYNDPAWTGRTPVGLELAVLVGNEAAGATLANLSGAPGQPGGPALSPSTMVLAYVLTLTTDTGGPQVGNVFDYRVISGPAVWGEDGHRYRIGVNGAGELGKSAII